MHVVIMGCGRVGAELAVRLDARDDTVAVIDRHPAAFRRLRADVPVQRVPGSGFDEAVLEQAGIERAGAFAAVSNADNANIVAARVARERFEVPIAVARIYDPRRAEVYQRLGIPTVATAKWAVDQVMRLLIPDQVVSVWKDPSEGVALITVAVPRAWAGRTVEEFEADGDRRVAGVIRDGHVRIPTGSLRLEGGDRLWVLVDVRGLHELHPLVMAAREHSPSGAGEP